MKQQKSDGDNRFEKIKREKQEKGKGLDGMLVTKKRKKEKEKTAFY